MKIFCSDKKIPLIPPLIINNQLITDFREKTTFFNLYFAKQCTHIENDSSIPTEKDCICDATNSAVDFEDQDILWSWSFYGHSHGNISTRIIKILTIVKPLSIIFRNYVNSGIFPDNWKR